MKEDNIGREHPFSTEKLGTLLSIFKYSGFESALEMVAKIYETQGKGHSCGIYSFNDEHIHQLAMIAPVSRMMVRQPQSKANAGSFTNGMPMTSTWVARPIAEDKPSDEELFGEFYNTETW